MSSDFQFPEFDEVAFEARLAAKRTERQRLDGIGGFRPVSLGDWMRLCREADVPTVATLSLGEADVEALLRYDEPEFAAQTQPFYTALAEKMAALGPGWMARWDCCSMAEVKGRLSEGEAEWSPVLAELYAEDVRAFDMIADFPGERIEAWARPWTAFQTLNGYPIEYRVFVERGAVVGVSNYYPQRPLLDNADTATDIARARAFAEALSRHQTRPVICQEIDGLEGNWFTADFARLPSGALIFLEGGPPHTPNWGAHPCCFSGGDVSGVALRDRTGLHEVDL